MKLLSKNDVGGTKSHQAGFLIPKQLVKNGLFAELSQDDLNPRLRLKFVDLDDGSEIYVSYIFYNNRLFGGTRSEYRLTGVTSWIRKKGLRAGDALQITKTGDYDYLIEVLKGERKPSTLTTESWIALYGEEKPNGTSI